MDSGTYSIFTIIKSRCCDSGAEVLNMTEMFPEVGEKTSRLDSSELFSAFKFPKQQNAALF